MWLIFKCREYIYGKSLFRRYCNSEHRELGFDYEVRLVGYEHDYENNG